MPGAELPKAPKPVFNPKAPKAKAEAPLVNAEGNVEPKAPKVKVRPVDGTGQAFITLSQFLKLQTLAETGGHAKAVVRDGGITVNGTAEQRPGRKLHAGDVVVVDGTTLTVTLPYGLQAEISNANA